MEISRQKFCIKALAWAAWRANEQKRSMAIGADANSGASAFAQPPAVCRALDEQEALALQR